MLLQLQRDRLLSTSTAIKPSQNPLNQNSFEQNYRQICNLLLSFTHSRSLVKGLQLHAHIVKFGLQTIPLVSHHLINLYSKTQLPLFSLQVFDEAPRKSSTTWSSVISAFAQNEVPLLALEFFRRMINVGIRPDDHIYPSATKACGFLCRCDVGKSIHCLVVKTGFDCDVFVGSSLVDMYAKCGVIGDARHVFDEMPERNVISWSAMMAAYSRVSDFREVLCLFRQMQEKDIKPNESVIVSVLTACAHLGAITQGLWMHSYAKRYGLDSNPILATALVDMYSKCGYIESALAVFESISNKDAGAWNAMISGVAMNGDVMKSLELFDKMIVNGTQATETTFVAILAACTHAKMVERGLKLFDQMYPVYGVRPQFEHYACVVDLMARAGMVEDAEKFVEEKMGGFSNVDANVWGAILGACRKYGNIEIGNKIWKKLSAMGVSDCGTQVLSYNIYSEAGWEMAAKEAISLIHKCKIYVKYLVLFLEWLSRRHLVE